MTVPSALRHRRRFDVFPTHTCLCHPLPFAHPSLPEGSGYVLRSGSGSGSSRIGFRFGSGSGFESGFRFRFGLGLVALFQESVNHGKSGAELGQIRLSFVASLCFPSMNESENQVSEIRPSTGECARGDLEGCPRSPFTNASIFGGYAFRAEGVSRAGCSAICARDASFVQRRFDHELEGEFCFSYNATAKSYDGY